MKINRFHSLLSLAFLAIFGLGAAVPISLAGSNPVFGLAASRENTTSTLPIGFHLSGRYILDANGNKFLMRGINHPHIWYPAETDSFADIRAAGANTIRVVLSSGQRWTKNSANDVANVISLCKANNLVCVLEVHDTTGYGEQSGAASLADAVAYWKEIQSVLTGQEAYVIINIGNEPYGNVNANDWVNATKTAIIEMRNAGFEHMLVVDAPNWGQDWQFIMRDNAADILAVDPMENTVFSVHMYGVYDSYNKVEDYVLTFVNAGLPLVIGEFGYMHSDGDPDEDAIMAIADQYRIGYLGWSWSGNSGGVEYLDMVVGFDPTQLTWWGNRIIHGPNGIKIFDDVPAGYWALELIERLYSAGITDGCSTIPPLYCPDAPVTRAQMAVFLERGIHYPTPFQPPAVPSIFTDTVGHWAEDWIEALRNDGITSGCAADLYCPEAPVTRAQMAVFLLRAKHGSTYNPPAVGADTGFADVVTDYWAAAWIKQLVAESITSGCGGGNYCPENPVTRAQMAVFLVKTFGLP